MNLPQPDAAFRWSREPWGAALRCRGLDLAAQDLFTSKQLQLPDPESWRQVTASLGVAPDRLMRVKQVHGNVVRVLKRGEVPANAAEHRPDGDAIVSNEAGLVLSVMVADCVPIVIVDPVAGAAAAIHAGWRGTCARVAPAAVAAMSREFGCRPEDLRAAIGPSVGADDYEVGESLIDAFRDAGHAADDIDRWFIRVRPRPHLDLWRANADQLRQSGLNGDHIYICGLSTVSHTEVFESYRVDRERAGRMAALVVVPRPGLEPPIP
jgi:YfiH family protein